MIYTSPSNLALIKYMGKKPNSKNDPINPSLSYTLKHLISGVKIEAHCAKEDIWLPLQKEGWKGLSLNTDEQVRFLSFFKKLKSIFLIEGYYKVYSSNNFQKSAGIASSASSFSALTQAAYQLSIKSLSHLMKRGSKELALISKEGSGSSCRSFFSPWCLWGDDIKGLSLAYDDLLHQVIVVHSESKSISSSDAHRRVVSSPFFKERKIRALQRLNDFLKAMNNHQWESLYQITKEEFQDMHELFETSTPAFSYRTQKVKDILEALDQLWKSYNDGPLVTMDAGASVHLLYRADQTQLQKEWNKYLIEKFLSLDIH